MTKDQIYKIIEVDIRHNCISGPEFNLISISSKNFSKNRRYHKITPPPFPQKKFTLKHPQ